MINPKPLTCWWICTVTVRWNTETPGQPYVELISLDGFTWNP